MKHVVLFDLGNTLVRYFDRSEFPAILERAINQVRDYLRQEGLLYVSSETIWRRVEEENHESRDHRVRPLEGRLARVFQLDESVRSERLTASMCRRFTIPIFACGRPYADTLPMLEELRSKGFRTAVVSNAPWGSPADLWREEIARLGLSARVDVAAFCGDVGWRKPARQIFEFTMQRLHVEPRQCVFVGDDPRWDLVGPRAAGIDAILIDRHRTSPGAEEGSIRELRQLWDKLYSL